MKKLEKILIESYTKSKDKIKWQNEVKEIIHTLSPLNQPVDLVRWVDIADVEPNDYNPNSVAKVEMSLLYKSIEQDGYTQPIVTIDDDEKEKYI